MSKSTVQWVHTLWISVVQLRRRTTTVVAFTDLANFNIHLSCCYNVMMQMTFCRQWSYLSRQGSDKRISGMQTLQNLVWHKTFHILVSWYHEMKIAFSSLMFFIFLFSSFRMSDRGKCNQLTGCIGHQATHLPDRTKEWTLQLSKMNVYSMTCCSCQGLKRLTSTKGKQSHCNLKPTDDIIQEILT